MAHTKVLLWEFSFQCFEECQSSLNITVLRLKRRKQFFL